MLNDRKRRADFFIASAMLASGLMLTGYSMVSVAQTTRVHLAQATPPVQSQPAPADNDKPAESKPGGTRPTTPAPEPARPGTQAQQEGAKPALPPAPPEKMAPPIQQKQ
ncbi:hypothetical protein [Bradyrhizobium erythrophlei]|uniref:Uncharacterized protein n=1 Tax=Bradyrhizobium erythrophlei TaxID=1437360 RepID=A0A1M7U747_9BRAD|nr:hypothetical protein [Bradyrhizobium erythrophlei]SHN78803.1 hypothetical protein SAMN05444170_3791 [Bradyrhizobium erythrophlei]